MAWVAEITGWDPVAQQEKSMRFAMGRGLALSDQSYIPGGLMRWSSPSQKIELATTGGVETTGDAGEIQISNVPDDITEAGPFDSLDDWAWQGRKASFFWVTDTWAGRVRTAWGTLEQPVMTLARGGDVQGQIRFPLRDRRAYLDMPLQPKKYAGTNANSLGVEGLADLKGRPKPVLYGRVSNIPGVRVNESLLIFQVADKAANILCVRDGGVSLTAGVVRATLDSLQASIPQAGRYDSFKSATGTYIRLGSKPIFTIGIDAVEDVALNERSNVSLWKRLRIERAGDTIATIDDVSVGAVYATDSAEGGFWWDDELSLRDALDEVLGGFSAFEVLTLEDKWKVAKLALPPTAAVPVLEFETLSPTAKVKAKTRKIVALERVRPSYAATGAPPYRITLKWGRNHSVMQPTEFAGSAQQRLIDKFGQEWRNEVRSNNAIWNPETKVGPWPNAPEIIVETGYQVDAAGTASAGASAEATRLQALVGSGLRHQFQIVFVPEPGDLILPGDIIKLVFPAMGLAQGVLLLVLQSGMVVDSIRGRRADLVVGFQRFSGE